ncbi:MAG: PQQ-binding-like beta-propeller repeat protein [Opitutaceae bacterium]|nr:PQQ-binding-like beta-propeller repeat protein [Verrucomicrobiales bacterium]
MRITSLSLQTALVVLIAAVMSGCVQSPDWPAWRGPLHTGHVPDGEAVPTKLPAEPKVLWKVKSGDGFASPVIANGKLFFLDNVGGKETLHAIDAASARELWTQSIDDTHKDSQGPAGPRCTPLVDGDRVYAQSCRGELQSRRVSDGAMVWRTSYTRDFQAVFIGEKGTAPGATRHGYNGSPVIDGPHLLAGVGGTNGAGVVCFDKLSGKVIWKSQNDQAAYAPPVVATMAGIKQVICFVTEGVIGLARDDGRLLWRIPVKTAFARHVTTPVVSGDYVVVASHEVGLIGIKLSKDGSGVKAEKAWVNKDAAMNFSSPVAVGSSLFGLGPTKNLICVDIPTGKLLWSKDGYINTSADKAHASFLVMKDNILASTDSGELVLFAADPKAFREINRVQVCSVNWCNPAYAAGILYLRDGLKTGGDVLAVRLLP